ncbi:ATP-binding cassette domain-containing protein [Lysinibacillus fusiformis]|uniref:ATP-binding cassette domain-containing protein n=1 Tax=Lysinibacillus fusiformis TaxID=28031 RepID=UPI003CF277AA
MEKEVLIRAQNVCKTFSTGSEQFHAIKKMNIDIYKGDFTVIMGNSGSGKSTLLYLYAIVTLCSSYLRKRKLQNGLMVVLIFLSTLLLATSVTILINTNNIFEKAHFDSNGAHQILTMGDDVHNPFVVNDWWEEPSFTKYLLPIAR